MNFVSYNAEMNLNFITIEMLAYGMFALLTLVVLLAIANISLSLKIRRLLRGKDAKSLEDTIVKLTNETDSLQSSKQDIEKYLAEAEKRISRSIQGVSTVRFNPFKGTGGGGNQSFATAILNENGDGVVISSLYSRDRVGVYAKPISKLKSEFTLTKEEKEAIAKAKLL